MLSLKECNFTNIYNTIKVDIKLINTIAWIEIARNQ